MKLQFEPNLDFQFDAINAACDLFIGQEVGESLFTVRRPKLGVTARQGYLYEDDHSGYANALRLPPEEVLENLRAVQLRNGLRQDETLNRRDGKPDLDFAVEMETGTGKTYVYLRTMLEMHERFGWTKFVVVVPSVTIKQGVLKSLEITRDHFHRLYNGVAMEHHEYDGSDLSRVRDFAVSRNVRVLVTTVQSIYPGSASGGANRIAYQPHEETGGDRPIDLIRGTNPIVIIDEPQSVEGGEDGMGAKAIRGLKPLAVLRYSATHLRKVHEVYRLDAVEAFRRKLVKRIEVAAATAKAAHNRPYVRLVKVQPRKGSGPRATLELDKATKAGGVTRKEVVLTGNEDLGDETGRDVYRDVRLGEVAHLDKELVRRPLGIKVLTLFFIDSVADYREYDAPGSDGNNPQPGRLARMFEAIYERKKKDPKYATLFGGIEKALPAAAVHDGYFAVDGKGRIKDTADTARSLNGRDAKEAFDLIMKHKERLLSLGEPLKFIFSHSALREGWDNPNVFQICSLRAMGSERQRRQTLGRGLRICVGADGARERDEDLNVLTVIAGESYADYAARLQSEYEEEGVVFGRIEPHEFARLHDEDEKPIGQDQSERLHVALQEKGYLDTKGKITDALRTALKEDEVEVPEGFETNAHAVVALLRERAGRRVGGADGDEKKKVRPQRAVIDSPAFQELWDRVKSRTVYRVDFDSRNLIASCVRSLRSLPGVERARVQWVTGGVEVERSGIELSDDVETETRFVDEVGVPVPDAVGLLQERTGLTRATVAAVLTQSGRAGELRRNPQAVVKLAGDVIEEKKQAAMVNGIEYERTGAVWAQTLFDAEFERDVKRLMEDGEKSAYDHVPVDSDVERSFLKELQSEATVKLFAKLPGEFRVPTPLGAYEPDWAVLVERDGQDRLYFVVETKGDLFESGLRGRESQKIACGKAHFKALEGEREKPAQYLKARCLDDVLASS